MSITRIKGVFLQEYFVTVHSYEVIFDIVFFPLMSVVVFGFLSTYLSGSNPIAGKYVLSGMLLWQIIFITQYSISMGSLWNIWSRNLSNMFIAPLTIKEYVFAHTASGILKSLFIFITTSILSFFVFHFNILDLGIWNIVLFAISFSFFAFSMGIIILGLIFRLGTRIQAFAWGILPVFQPLTAAFYPLNVLPGFLRDISYLLPPTFVFEASRKALLTHQTDWNLLGISFAENIVYFLLAIWFFSLMFRQSKESGQFARNES